MGLIRACELDIHRPIDESVNISSTPPPVPNSLPGTHFFPLCGNNYDPSGRRDRCAVRVDTLSRVR